MAATPCSCPAACTHSIPPGVPDFVVAHAPLLYMHPDEIYMPSDIQNQLAHTTAKIKTADLPESAKPLLENLTLHNLDQLNQYGTQGTDVYLMSNDDVTKEPEWLLGIKPQLGGKVPNAKTCAVVVCEKENGIVDAFFFYFNAFNWGGKVFGDNLGNHVGDWESNMVRFENGVPKYVWYSQHASGQSFTYEAVHKDKNQLRPISFCALGSHANYAIPGRHNHTIPELHSKLPGGLDDYTDAGPLYDPICSAYWYKWTAPPLAKAPTGNQKVVAPNAPIDNVSKWGTFTPYDPSYPVGWLYYQGRFGDQRYPASDKRQSSIFGLVWRYEDGPTGPADKDLGRKEVWSGSNHKIYDHLVS